MSSTTVNVDNTYAGIVVLTAAQVRLLSTAQPLNGHKGIRPHGPQWRAAEYLKQHGLIEPVIVKHAGCSLGEFKCTKRGRQVLDKIWPLKEKGR